MYIASIDMFKYLGEIIVTSEMTFQTNHFLLFLQYKARWMGIEDSCIFLLHFGQAFGFQFLRLYFAFSSSVASSGCTSTKCRSMSHLSRNSSKQPSSVALHQTGFVWYRFCFFAAVFSVLFLALYFEFCFHCTITLLILRLLACRISSAARCSLSS